MKKRVYFDKTKEMKFISHLDLLRFFERLINKSDIPIKYSNGFHPRPRMSFGNPISLGTEAYNEVMDFEITEPISNEEVKDRLNSSEVIGFYVRKVEDVDKKSSISDIFTNILYEIEGEKSDIDKIEELLNQDEILQIKEKRGKTKKRNLKDRILSIKRDGNILNLEIINMSPNTFITMADVDISDVMIKRLGYKIEENN